MELEHAIGFNGNASHAMHVLPNDDTIVYVLGGCVVVEQLRDAHNQIFLRGHDDMITCLDVSSSGRLIASGQTGENADVVIWEYPSGAELYRLQEHDHGMKSVHFTSDERFLLTVGADKKMVVWDMLTGCIVAKTGTLKQMPQCACWGGRARDTKGRETTSFQLATGGEGQLTYWILDPQAGSLTAEECTLGNQVRNFTALAFSEDATYLFAGSSSSDFTAVHVKHKVMHSTTVCGSNGIAAIVCQATADGDRLIVGCGDGLVTVLEGQRNGAQTCRTYSKGPADRCSVMLDGGVRALHARPTDEQSGQLRLLAGTDRGTLFGVSLSAPDYRAPSAPLAATKILQDAHYDKVVAVSYPSDNSEVFATASADGSVRVWDVNNYQVLAKGGCQTRVTGEPLCLAFTGEVLFSGWEDGRIRAHEADEGEELWSIDNCHRGGVTAIVVSHNRKFLVSGGAEGEVRVWEIRTREMVVNLKQHTSSVTALRLLADDSGVYSSSRDRTILQWDLRSETRSRYMVQRMGGINAIDTMPLNEAHLVSVGQEKRLTTWVNAESAPIASVGAPPESMMGEQMCVAVCLPEGVPKSAQYALCATGGGGDCRVRLWTFSTAKALTPVLITSGAGHSSTVRALQFSPDGKQLVSVGEDGAVLVWNIFVDEIFPDVQAAAPPPA